MRSQFLVRVVCLALAALLVPVTGQAQLGKLGKKIGKAVGDQVVKKDDAKANNAAPSLTPDMVDAYLKGVEVEGEPQLAARAQYHADSVAFAQWEARVKALSQQMESVMTNNAASKCAQQQSSSPDMMALQREMAKKLDDLDDDAREKLEAQLEALTDKIEAAYARNDMNAVGAHAAEIRRLIGLDVNQGAAVAQGMSQCMQQHGNTTPDMNRYAQLQADMNALGQQRPNEPRRPEPSQKQRGKWRLDGLKASGLTQAEYAWAQEQVAAYLAAVNRNEDMSSLDKNWVSMMKAREATMKKYAFVIADFSWPDEG